MHELMSLQEYTKVLNSLEMHQNDDTDESQVVNISVVTDIQT